MAKQRKTRNLGYNQSRKAPDVYQELISKGITKKRCSRSSTEPHYRYGFVHEGPNPCDIKEFNLQSSSSDGLQPNCRACEKKYRKGRSQRYRNIYSVMEPHEIYSNYKSKYQEFKRCGRCGKMKDPSFFPISINMESGLHNQCFSCSNAYRESVGDRWIIYSPDGHTPKKMMKGMTCSNCNSSDKLHFDHKWPISKGGTDNIENIQVLCAKCNLSKSNEVDDFNEISEIHSNMICSRYLHLLKDAQIKNISIRLFEIEIEKNVQNFLLWKSNLDDTALRAFFSQEKKLNNRKFNIQRCVEKFRRYANRNS